MSSYQDYYCLINEIKYNIGTHRSQLICTISFQLVDLGITNNYRGMSGSAVLLKVFLQLRVNFANDNKNYVDDDKQCIH